MKNIDRLKNTYFKIYGNHLEVEQAFENLQDIITEADKQRDNRLKEMDKKESNWYFSNKMVGMTLYTDLFAGSFSKLSKKIDYFKELGITYLHLMPLLKPREGENDGGYAVEDYKNVDPLLGTLEEFEKLLKIYNKSGIKICIDYVVNHVAKEHAWAQKALNNEKQYQDMFIMFDDETTPNLYNQTVPEVLPDKCPGNFTYYPEIDKYVFTSFSHFQWDLNFQNPYVFNGMVDNLLYLANLGVNMIRLDAIPFMWKEINTTCRNLEPIHDLMHMFYLIKEDVCPSCALLGEAIVEPEQIVSYFGDNHQTECEVMYNANLMVDIYNSFASRDARLMTIDANRFQLPKKGTWMNYVRCHDDIGWGFNEQAVAELGFDPHAHKQFLIQFYGNNFHDTFSKGEYYQYNPKNQDARTNGTLASLLGLEKAIDEKREYKRYESIRRINLAHALIMSYKGIPLIYSGDEIATLNDQSYKEDPNKQKEGRWVHRPFFDWKRAKNKEICDTNEYDVYQALKEMIKQRKKLPQLHGQTEQYAIDTQNKHVFCFIRKHQSKTLIAMFNFSEMSQNVNVYALRQFATSSKYKDVFSNRSINLYDEKIELSPYEYLWCIQV